MKLLAIVGARPNFMKIKPVIDELQARGADVHLVHTGQHYDRLMSDVLFDELGLSPPQTHLGVGSGSHAETTAKVMLGLEPVIARERPDTVLVVGDVNSTVAAALVAAKLGVAVGHIEAGLRSGDRTMPEELNRIVTDRLSDHLFAPSADAVENLLREGEDESKVYLVGNVMIDTLFTALPKANKSGVLARLGLEEGGFGLVTLHRPSTVDHQDVLGNVLRALVEISRGCPLYFPAHPRTAARLPTDLPDTMRVGPPLGYLDFIALESSARLVLTDSGGVQEETTALGVPCLTIRDNTERPITISEGTNTLVGTAPARIIEVARQTLQDPPPARRPLLWDGHAATRIVDALAV